MLIDFTVENFRSYRHAKTLSLTASPAKELRDNLIELADSKDRLLRTAAIYGANASGKSNLLAAMYLLSDLLRSPMAGPAAPEQAQTQLLPFGLDPSAAARSTRFQVRFLMGGALYEYDLSARPGLVENELLVVSPAGHRQEWFHRTSDAVEFNSTHLKGPKESVKELTMGAAGVPLLAVAKAFAHPQLTPVTDWLVDNLANRDDEWEHRRPRGAHLRPSASARLLHENKDFRVWANAVIRHADFGVQGVEIKVVEQKVMRPVSRPAGSGSGRVTTVEETTIQYPVPLFIHTGEGKLTAAFGEDAESQGTRRFFSMLAPLYDVFQKGQLAIIDEFGTSMHPYLAREIIRLFLSKKVNPKGSQLVFATHDTAMLSGRFLRRDQVWFTEKDHAGATDLYSLQDIKGVRSNDPLQKGYLGGRYGAIPFFGPLDIVSEGEEEGPGGAPEPPSASSPEAVS